MNFPIFFGVTAKPRQFFDVFCDPKGPVLRPERPSASEAAGASGFGGSDGQMSRIFLGI